MFRNYVKISFAGYSPERFLNLCKHKEIEIWGLEAIEEGYVCYLSAKDFREIKPLVKKTRIKVKIIERHGAAFWLFRYRKRKVFLIGIFIGFVLLYFMTSFIWNIEIEGNLSITDDVLYEYLETQNVFHGMPRKNVKCEEICTILRRDFSEIIWVATSLEGTNLIINVRENTDTFIEKTEISSLHHIVADEDGIVTSIITRKGVPQVSVGDEVKKGDILVSGIVEVTNDAGEVVREEHMQAEADIYLKRVISYQDAVLDSHNIKDYYKTKKKIISFSIINYQCNLGVLKREGNQEIISEIYQCKIGENFLLPVFLGLHTSREYEWKEVLYKESEQREILEENYRRFCEKIVESGGKIEKEELLFQKQDGKLAYQGHIEVIQQVVDLY